MIKSKNDFATNHQYHTKMDGINAKLKHDRQKHRRHQHNGGQRLHEHENKEKEQDDLSPDDIKNVCGGGLYFPQEGIDFTAFMEQMKNDYIKTALERTKGNEAKAPRLLKLNHHTFRYHFI